MASKAPADQRVCCLKNSVHDDGPSPTATRSGVYTDRQWRPVASLTEEWMRRLVAMSSVIESAEPWRMALVRMAALVPTSIAQPRRLPARWITLWKRYWADSAQRV